MSNLLILNSWRSQHVFCPRPGVTLIGVVGKPAAHWQIRRSTIRMQRPRIGGSPTILWSCTPSMFASYLRYILAYRSFLILGLNMKKKSLKGNIRYFSGFGI